MNDVFSYQKEIQFEGEIHNGVLVVQNFLNCGFPEALAIVNDLMTSRMRQFEHVVNLELPALYDDYDLDADARATLDGYADELKNWMAGIHTWHAGCRRYQEAELLRNIASMDGQLGSAETPGTVGTPGSFGVLGSIGAPPGLPSFSPSAAAAEGVPAMATLPFAGPTGLGTAGARIRPPEPLTTGA
jgi:germacradienol/geosmin synthase